MKNTRSLFRALSLAAAVGLLAQTAPAAEPEAVVRPFNGRNLEGWSLQKAPAKGQWGNHWKAGSAVLDPQDPARLKVSPAGPQAAELVNAEGHSLNIYTRQTFADCTIRLEFMVPKGSNSGVYMMGEYEVQIKDSFGKPELTYQDLGAIYKTAVPRVNAARRAGQWQELLIEFRAPRFADGKKTANARFVKVVLNGQTIHENVQAGGATQSGLTGRESARGPLMLQGDHGPVAYRNLTIAPH